MLDKYEQRGFNSGRIGFGDRPGLAVVDFQLAFTDARFPLGGSEMVESAVQHTQTLLTAARAADLPVANCYVAYSGRRDAPYWKIEPVLEEFRHGHPCTKLDPRTYDQTHDAVFCKAGPSLFFQTAAISFFTKERVDTLIVVGCNTSGCVRATVTDAFSYGFRVVVPCECVGDVDEGPHNDNLRDVGRRYADIVPLQEVLAYIDTIRGRNDQHVKRR